MNWRRASVEPLAGFPCLLRCRHSLGGIFAEIATYSAEDGGWYKRDGNKVNSVEWWVPLYEIPEPEDDNDPH